MKRYCFSIQPADPALLKQKVLEACGRESHAAFLNSNSHCNPHSRYEWIAAIGASHILECNSECFDALKNFRQAQGDWLFGHMSYDLKNDLEKLSTRHSDPMEFARLSFFVPQSLVFANTDGIQVQSLVYQNSSEFLSAMEELNPQLHESTPVQLEARTSRQDYLENIHRLKQHLQYGNIYEVNYCVEFAAMVESFSPLDAFRRLNTASQAPFAAFYRRKDQYLLCASPERYLQKSGLKILSQPIKGTAPRSPDPDNDRLHIEKLRQSEKEQSENVMITDLVRNDLSRTAARGSVQVEELFGIYSFNTVHQMISSVSSQLDSRYSVEEVLKTSFPMGSMTGAPKVRAMELIDEHENFARSLYAGSVGYISPDGNCDFNVVIRSLLFNAKTKYLSARVGSAITIHCEPGDEYEECLLKAKALFKALEPEAINSIE